MFVIKDFVRRRAGMREFRGARTFWCVLYLRDELSNPEQNPFSRTLKSSQIKIKEHAYQFCRA